MAQPPASELPAIDCAFPGGNIIVDRQAGDTVFLRQDLRDTEGDWFYWCFRVRGAAGRRLSFYFTAGDVIGVRGPAVSRDGGETWAWLGRDCVIETAFTHTFGEGDADVRFCFGMPYQEPRLERVLAGVAGRPDLRRDLLCRTTKGRVIERLHVGCLERVPAHRVLVTCRHHCCEMMASYAAEGLLEAVLTGDECGLRWLRENVELLLIPFVDKDGVEDGDQGKNRRPHDHNRDYGSECVHAAPRALREFVPAWSDGRLRAAFDLHCPWIRGHWNEVIYHVGSPEPRLWEEQNRFASVQEATQREYLRVRAADNLPFGQDWNVGQLGIDQQTFAGWAGTLPGIRLATTIELPYANAGGFEVNQTTAKRFGYDLARALAAYLQER